LYCGGQFYENVFKLFRRKEKALVQSISQAFFKTIQGLIKDNSAIYVGELALFFRMTWKICLIGSYMCD